MCHNVFTMLIWSTYITKGGLTANIKKLGEKISSFTAMHPPVMIYRISCAVMLVIGLALSSIMGSHEVLGVLRVKPVEVKPWAY